MERSVNFQNGMDLDPADFNNLQDFTRGSLDHIVGDAITPLRKYAGFAAAIATPTTLTVGAGRLFSAGKVYASDGLTGTNAVDFTTRLPLATKKMACIVAWGGEQERDSRPREFLLNEEDGSSEPRVVAMEHARVANLNVIYGTENADPLPPVPDAGSIVVATVLLTPTGISSVTMDAGNSIASLQGVADRTKDLEQFRDQAGPQMLTIANDVAALTRGQANMVNGEQYGRTLARLAVLEAKGGIPTSAVDSRANFFLDLSHSDPNFAGYAAKVEEGIRFPDAAQATAALQLFNPIDAKATIVGNTLFPRFDLVKRMTSGVEAGQVQISSYTYMTHQLQQLDMSRVRVRYGSSQTVCTNSGWWKSGQYDPVTHIFRANGETWQVDPADYARATQDHQMIRVTIFWEDVLESSYMVDNPTEHNVNGSQVAQTWLQPNDMWLGAVGLTFKVLADNGSVTLAVCETDRGVAQLDKAISVTTVDRASLKLNEETRIVLQPTFLTGGKRYALVIVTAANHWIATVQGSDFPTGTFFYVLDGAYQQGDGSRDVLFSLYAARFAAARAVIDLQPLALAGGIADIDILAPGIIPGSTDLTFEVQVGATWYPLSRAAELNLGSGGSAPPLLPFRVVFNGTPDVMPGLRLAGSQVKVSRPAVALTHISDIWNLPGSGSSQIRVIARLEYFDAAHHSVTAKLLTGAGYTTQNSPSSFSDVVRTEGGVTMVERTYVFNLGAPVTSCRTRFDATTDSPFRIFHFGWEKDFAL